MVSCCRKVCFLVETLFTGCIWSIEDEVICVFLNCIFKCQRTISNTNINSVIFKNSLYIFLESLKLPFFMYLNILWQSLDPSQCKCVSSAVVLIFLPVQTESACDHIGREKAGPWKWTLESRLRSFPTLFHLDRMYLPTAGQTRVQESKATHLCSLLLVTHVETGQSGHSGWDHLPVLH